MKNKKRLLVAGGIASVLAIGGTIAVNNDLLNFANEFKLGANVFEFKETFESPTNWQPCDETPKTVIATNKNDEDRYVRIKIDEYWRTKDTETSADDHTTSDLAFTWTDANEVEHRYAIINLDNQEDWEYRDGWYYYKEAIGKNESTNSPIQSVTLNCDANFVSTVTYDADHLSGESVPSDYAGATYHLYITGQISSEPWELDPKVSLLETIRDKANDPDAYTIDFRRRAVISDNISTANGNGVNEYTEDGKTVYYYRGQIDDNNVIWANMCWQIIRTTSTNGIKMIYNGLPTSVDVEGKTVNQCLASGSDKSIKMTIDGTETQRFYFHGEVASGDGTGSIADFGYMYGDRLRPGYISRTSGKTFTFSNNVSYEDGVYTLDLSEGKYVTGEWNNVRTVSANGMHYFCDNGATSCGDDNIGYVLSYKSSYIYYVGIGGYEDIEAAKAAAFSNDHDSYAKTILESWFENNNLTDHESELEDAVFCNEREFYEGPIVGKDSISRTDTSMHTKTMAQYRNMVDVDNNYHPSLDCASKRDSFTKTETSKGNGMLSHEIGLITADELTLAAITGYDSVSSNFLYTSGLGTFTMSPFSYGSAPFMSYAASSHSYLYANNGWDTGLRPVVSLKAGTGYNEGGDGTKTNPYVVE